MKDPAEQQVGCEEELVLAGLDHRAHHGGQDLCVLLRQIHASHGGDVVDVVVFSGENTPVNTKSWTEKHIRADDLELLVSSASVFKCMSERLRRFPRHSRSH